MSPFKVLPPSATFLLLIYTPLRPRRTLPPSTFPPPMLPPPRFPPPNIHLYMIIASFVTSLLHALPCA
jgi:hypothetical protein